METPCLRQNRQKLISRIDDKCSKAFNAHQGKFGSQWLNVVPCKNLGLKLDDQLLRISIDLRLEANICVAHTCHCGKRVELFIKLQFFSAFSEIHVQFLI